MTFLTVAESDNAVLTQALGVRHYQTQQNLEDSGLQTRASGRSETAEHAVHSNKLIQK